MAGAADVTPWRAGLLGRCPRCGEGRLFAGALRLADRCGACGLDLRAANVGDGPAPFIMLFAGGAGVGLGVWMQLALDAPFWALVAVTFPVIAALSLGLMRPLKGLMLALQYHHAAGDSGHGGFGTAAPEGDGGDG